MSDYKHLFGPVPSRRLGISLGVDVIPAKTCTLNCVYCEAGRTTDHTCRRREFVSPRTVIAELDAFLSTTPELDYITFSGAGEPTLYTGLGTVNDFVKKQYPRYSTALLTNGTLFFRDDVRRECMDIDLVFPSVDAGDHETFTAVSRPHDSLDFKRVVDGLRIFAAEYSGKLWLEVFLLPDMNMTDTALDRIRSILDGIPHEKIYLNTLDRPGTVPGLKKADWEQLVAVRDRFGPETEIAARKPRKHVTVSLSGSREAALLKTIAIRPLTQNDISEMTGLQDNEVIQCIRSLEKKGRIVRKRVGDEVFFSPAQSSGM